MITGVVGSRNVTTETRSFNEDFTGIRVSQGIEVQLTQDNEVSFTAEMDDNLHEHLITEVVDDVLKIYFDDNVRKRKESTIYLSMPNISSIKTSSGADVIGTNIINTDNLTIDSSSGSEVNLDIEATSISSEASSGSQIELKGNCESFTADSSSGSQIDADNLKAKDVEAEASSGADVDVFASGSIDAKASSGGSIDVNGNPKTKIIKKSSGGQVRVD
jgi:hypothetical protein